MSEFVTKLTELYNIDIIELLLKNDIIIYGSFVKEYFILDRDFGDVIGDQEMITCMGKLKYMDIIERDFFHISEECEHVDIKYSKKSTILTCKHEDKSYKIQITYVSDGIIPNRSDFNILNFNTLTEHDLFYISRNGFGLLEIPKKWKHCPNPLKEIINNIIEYKFTIIEDEFEKESLERLLKFIDSGYSNLNRKIKIRKGSSYLEDECSICKEAYLSGETLYKLPCHHMFHSKCWIKKIKLQNLINEPSHTNCPLCRRKYPITQVI